MRHCPMLLASTPIEDTCPFKILVETAVSVEGPAITNVSKSSRICGKKEGARKNVGFEKTCFELLCLFYLDYLRVDAADLDGALGGRGD